AAARIQHEQALGVRTPAIRLGAILVGVDRRNKRPVADELFLERLLLRYRARGRHRSRAHGESAFGNHIASIHDGSPLDNTVADMSDQWLASQKWMSVEIGCTPADGTIAAGSQYGASAWLLGGSRRSLHPLPRVAEGADRDLCRIGTCRI